MDMKVVDVLTKLHGDQIVLFDENDEELEYRIVKEIEMNGKHYAALLEKDREEDELEIFIVTIKDENYELETIEDDEEWETAAEAFDDLFYGEEKE